MARRAAAAAGGGNANPYVIEALTALAADPEFDVRQELAYACKNFPHWPMAPAIERLLADADSNTRQAAAWAAQNHPTLVAPLLVRLAAEDDTWVRSEVAHVLAGCPPRQVMAGLLERIGKDPDVGVQQACATSLEKHLAALGSYPPGLDKPSGKVLSDIRQRVSVFTYGSYATLKSWLNQELAGFVDLDGLAEYGTILTYEAEAGQLPGAHGYDAFADAVLAILDGAPPRAVVLLGESGAGKTALAHAVVHRLRAHPSGAIYVLRMTPQDFMVNTRYIGEWETRVRNLVNAVRPPRRIVLYVPNVEELAWMGTWAKSDANVASNLAPYLERGELTLLGESTVEAFRKGLGANRSLRKLFHAVELPPADDAATRAILRAVAEEAAVDVSDAVLARLSELAEYFASGSVQPGRSVGLLRKVIGLTEDRPGPITEQDILSTLAGSTGIPVELLDDRVALKRDAVRVFRVARHGPGRGGRGRRRYGHPGQGRPERSQQAVRRLPVRRPHGSGQDRAGPRPGRASLRRRGPARPLRHERICDLRGLRTADRQCRPRRAGAAYEHRARTAVRGDLARRDREGAPEYLQPLLAAFRRGPADRRAGSDRRFSPHDHHSHVERRLDHRDRTAAGPGARRRRRRAAKRSCASWAAGFDRSS